MKVTENLIISLYQKIINRAQMKPENFVAAFLVIFAAAIIFAIAAVWFVDPYIRYHRGFGLKEVYRQSEAMMPGVLRNFDFDTVLFGSSVCQNFDLDEINKILHCRSVKATTPGLESETLDKCLELVLKERKGEVKRCLIGADLFCFSRNISPRWKDYHYLYTDDIFIPEYFFSIDSAKAVGEVLESNIKPDKTARFRMMESKMFSNKPGIPYGKKYLEYGVTQLRENRSAMSDDCLTNFENHLYRHIRNNPDVQFDIFLPPYSIYFWCFQVELGELEKMLEYRRRFAEGLQNFPNAVLHDFNADFSICSNLENFKDVSHYSPAVNTEILKKIHSGAVKCDFAQFIRNNESIRSETQKHQAEFDRLRSGAVQPR